MTCNVGGMERAIRILLGVILLTAGAFAGLPTWGMVLSYVVGGIALVTGAVGFCPAYLLFGINTCQMKPTGKA